MDQDEIRDDDTAAHRLAANDNETVVDGVVRRASTVIADEAEDDVEGQRLAANDNETVIDGVVKRASL